MSQTMHLLLLLRRRVAVAVLASAFLGRRIHAAARDVHGSVRIDWVVSQSWVRVRGVGKPLREPCSCALLGWAVLCCAAIRNKDPG